MPREQTIPNALKAWRRRQKIKTKAAGAATLGVPYRTYQDWELGLHEPRGLARILLLERLRQKN